MYENLMKNDTPITKIDSHIIEHSAGLVDSILNEDEELQHHGVKGQKWGVRRYQNKDGSLTSEGKNRHYHNEDGSITPEGQKHVFKTLIKYANSKERGAKLGQAVGEDDLITEAAKKALPALMTCKKTRTPFSELLDTMEREYEKEMGLKGADPDKAYELIENKYGKKRDELGDKVLEAHHAYTNTLNNIAKDYLGEYGDKMVGNRTATNALRTQIDWGIQLGRLGNEIEHSNFDISEELAHHGTKGMKWGIRKYQNKDGSLTPAGRKRYGSFSDAIKKYNKKKQLKKAREAKAAKEAAAKQRAEDIKQGRIKPKDMSLDELMNAKKRLEMERDYKKLFDQLNPPDKVVEEGKSFAKKFWDEAAKPAMVTAGKTLLTDALNKEVKKIVGDKADKAMEKLKKDADEWDLKSKIQRAKKNIASDERQEWNQKRGFEEDKEEAAKANQDKNQARSAEEYEKTNSQYSKKNDNSNNSITDPTYRTPEYFIKNNLLLTGPTFEKNVNSGKDIVDSILDRNDVISMVDDDDEPYFVKIRHSADISEEELKHWGIKGQKWGIRRFQNKDGSLTDAGKKRRNENSGDKNISKLEMSNPERAIEIEKALFKKGSIDPLYSNSSPSSNRKDVTMAYRNDNLYRALQAAEQKASKEGYSSKNIKEIDSIHSEIVSKYGKAYAKATLKDLGLKNISKDDIDYTIQKLQSKEILVDRDDINALQIFGDKNIRDYL